MFWILIVMICLIIALKGQFSAKPFLTITVCVAGIAFDSFYLGNVAPIFDSLHWLRKWIVVVLCIIDFGFLWMFFRSLDHLLEIHHKLKQIASDLRTENDDLLTKNEELKQSLCHCDLSD